MAGISFVERRKALGYLAVGNLPVRHAIVLNGGKPGSAAQRHRDREDDRHECQATRTQRPNGNRDVAQRVLSNNTASLRAVAIAQYSQTHHGHRLRMRFRRLRAFHTRLQGDLRRDARQLEFVVGRAFVLREGTRDDEDCSP
jgi:hypothetical protein